LLANEKGDPLDQTLVSKTAQKKWRRASGGAIVAVDEERNHNPHERGRPSAKMR
jgi:hypothetical protein